ncbi:hypothetical protein BD311DRAFT_750392, partial [Dichomitus squalens]
SCAHLQPTLGPESTGAWTGRRGDVRQVVCGGVCEADVSRDSRSEKSPGQLCSCLTVQTK